MGGVQLFIDDGVPHLAWRNRDDTTYSIDTAARALSGTLMGNGVFGVGYGLPLYPEGGHTVGSANVDGEWVALLATPSYETTADHDRAMGGGNLLNLWLRRAPLEGNGAQPLTHFTGLQAIASSPQTVSLCFNRELEPTSLPTASLTAEGLEDDRHCGAHLGRVSRRRLLHRHADTHRRSWRGHAARRRHAVARPKPDLVAV